MALSLEGIRNRLQQQGLISSEPEPSFYTYGAVPTAQVTGDFAAEQARKTQIAEQARVAEENRLAEIRRLQQQAEERARAAQEAQARAAQEAQARAAQERAAKEAEAARVAEQQRVAREEAQRAEAARVAEQQRVQREAAQRAEAERVARERAEAARVAEQQRVQREAAARAEQERVARENAARAEAARVAEQQRVQREAAARAEQERIARETAARKAEEERVAREATARAEQERVAREAAARAEADRVARETAARSEAERVARQAELDRITRQQEEARLAEQARIAEEQRAEEARRTAQAASPLTQPEERNPVTQMPGTKPEGSAPAAGGSRVVPPEGYPPGTVGSAYEPGATLPEGVDPMAPVGATDPEQTAKMMAMLSLLPPGTFGNMGSVADPNIAGSAKEITDTRPAGGLQGQQFEEGYLEAQKEGPLLGIWQPGLESALEENPELETRVQEMETERAERIAGLEESIPKLKPLSDLLKAGQFKEAFEYAKANGLTDQLMKTENLKNLRGPFSKEEMSAFFKSIPADVAEQFSGEGWIFDPNAGAEGSLDPLGTGGEGAMNEGFPDPSRAFTRRESDLVKNLVKIAGAAMLSTAIPGLLPGAAESTAAGGAAGAGGAGAAGAGGAAGAAGAGAAGAGAAAGALPTFTVTTGGGLGAAGTATAIGAGAAGVGAATGGGGGTAATQPTTTTSPPMEEVVVTGTAPTTPPLSTAVPVAGGTVAATQPSGGLPAETAPPMEEVVVETTKPVEPPLEVVAPVVGGTVGVTQPSGGLPTETAPPMEEVVVEGTKPVEPPLEVIGPVVGGTVVATQPSGPPDVTEPPMEEVPEEESPLDKLKGVTDKLSAVQKLLALLGGLGGALGGRGGAGTGGGGLPVARDEGALPVYEFGRVQTRPDIDYFTYGTRPEELFFQDTMNRVEPLPQPPPNPNLDAGIAPPSEAGPFAEGGLAAGGRYYEGKGSGRDDKIPALLSDGEYVIDAETLALLGDGSTKEGARRMDQFRAKIRKHKGNALSRGRISPNAKSPDKYMGGGLRR